MGEKIDELYKQYLEEKIKSIFSGIKSTDCYIDFPRRMKNKPSKCSIRQYGYGYMFYDEDGRPFFDYAIVMASFSQFREGFLQINNDYLSEQGVFLFNSKLDKRVIGIDRDRGYFLHNNSGFSAAGDFHEGYARVRLDGKCNYIDYQGHFVFDKWYDDVGDFHEGYARVCLNGKWNYIDYRGNVIFNGWFEDAKDVILGVAQVQDGSAKVNLYIGMKNYDVKERKILGGYKCTSASRKFVMKYLPVKSYNEKFILCTDSKDYYMYDVLNNQYRNLGPIDSLVYDDNFICDHKNKKVFLVFNNIILDVTDYYYKYLDKLDKIKINFNVGMILSREEFAFLNASQIEQVMQEEARRKRKEKEEEEKRKKLDEIEAQKKKLQQEKEELQKKKEELQARAQYEKIEALKIIQEGLATLKNCGVKDLPIIREKIDNIFVIKDNHKEIDSDYIGILMLIDLLNVDFTNVKVSGIDFRSTNIEISSYNLNPQTIYNKDLSNCNFEGIHISPLAKFKGVDIRGTKFSIDNNPMTLDVFNTTFKDATWDENTTYNGKSFSEIFDETKKISK